MANPFPAIHPSTIFFAEISARIAAASSTQDEEAQYQLEIATINDLFPILNIMSQILTRTRLNLPREEYLTIYSKDQAHYVLLDDLYRYLSLSTEQASQMWESSPHLITELNDIFDASRKTNKCVSTISKKGLIRLLSDSLLTKDHVLHGNTNATALFLSLAEVGIEGLFHISLRN